MIGRVAAATWDALLLGHKLVQMVPFGGAAEALVLDTLFGPEEPYEPAPPTSPATPPPWRP